MSNNQNDYDEFLSIWEKEHPQSEQVQPKSEQRPISASRTPVRRPHNTKGRYLSKRMAAIRRQRQMRILIGASAAFLALLVLLIVLLCRGCSGSNKELRELQGCWYYNEYTEYEFDGEGNGRMFYEEGKAFEYTYTVKDNIVYLDFELDYVTDCQYTYTVEGDKLTLIGGEGTAEIGKEYVLTKLHEHNEK